MPDIGEKVPEARLQPIKSRIAHPVQLVAQLFVLLA
jgi:hypothetical protein